MTTELGVCWVPAERQLWNPPDPTSASWKAARDINITHVRMAYAIDNPRYFEPSLRAARDGGMRVTANMIGGTLEYAMPALIDAAAFALMKNYGSELVAVSFGNEYGGLPGMSPQAPVLDISQGGTFDFIKEAIGPRLLAFMRGARRVMSSVVFELFDSDSTDVQQRSQELLLGTEFENDPNIIWTAHNYADIGGDSSKGDHAGQDYSSMAGMNGKPGFLSVFEDPRFAVTIEVPPPPPGVMPPSRGFINTKRPRGWLISEIGQASGPPLEFGGIATPSDMQTMMRYSRMMLSKYPQCARVSFGTAEYFFTRVETQPWLKPPPTWTTWRFGDPVVSADGKKLAALFANGPIDPPVKALPIPGRRPGRGR
jgi:hypothetical protein